MKATIRYKLPPEEDIWVFVKKYFGRLAIASPAPVDECLLNFFSMEPPAVKIRRPQNSRGEDTFNVTL